MPINLQLPADLDAGMRALEQHTDGVMAASWIENGFTHAWGVIVRWEIMSDKWVRFDRYCVTIPSVGVVPLGVEPITLMQERREGVYCFVALQDYTTKALGQVIRGGIYKAATYKAPAKHARGNVLTGDMACIGPYGVAYLR